MRRVPKKQLALQPVVSSEFDECTRSENFIEILRFRHFARYMSFTPTGKQGKKNRKDACFQNFWKMSVLFFYSKAKEKIKNGTEARNVFIREPRAGCRCFVRQIPIWRKQPFRLNLWPVPAADLISISPLSKDEQKISDFCLSLHNLNFKTNLLMPI